MKGPSRAKVLGFAALIALFLAGRTAIRGSAVSGRVILDAISSLRPRAPRPYAASPRRAQREDPDEPDREYVRSLKIADVPMPDSYKSKASAAPNAASASSSDERLPFPEFGPQAAPSANANLPRLGHISIPRSAFAGGTKISAADDAPEAAQKNSPAAKTGSSEVAAEAATVAAAVREIKAHAAASAGTKDAPVQRAALMRRLDVDQKVDAGLRRALAGFASSGRTASPEELHRAFVEVLRGHGLTEDDVDEEVALARADSPPPPPIAPEALEKAVDEILAVPPEPAAPEPPEAAKRPKVRLRDVPRETMAPLPEPEPPHAPPPRGALEAYKENRAVLDRAQKEFGVRPQDILAILYVETRYGRNTGTNPEIPALNKMGERHALQSVNDKAALARLNAGGGLGGRAPGQMLGSVTGAIGAEQCQPSSCEAFGRSASGGTIDPYSLPDAILFVANYLHRSGYSRDVAASIRAYNHSDAYVKSVMQVSERVAAGLPPPEQR